MTVSGIDISSYQSSTYSTSGLGFVIIKVTEGTSYLSSKYAAQVAHARANNLVVGHYHFVRPGSMSAQVTWFLSHVKLAAGDLLVLDWEDTGVSCADKDAWIKAVQAKQPSHQTLLYCNRDFWLNRDTTSFCGDGLWIADPSVAAGSPRVEHPWVLHQYSETGGLDHDVANFSTAAALRAWANKTVITEESTMALTADDINKIAAAVWNADVIPAARPPYQNSDYKTNPTWQAKYAIQTAVEGGRTAAAQTAGLLAAVQTLAGKVGSGEDTAAIVSAVQDAVKNAVIQVQITEAPSAT